MGTLRATAATLIPAPLDEVWAAIADVTSGAEWQRGVAAIRPLELDESGRVALAHLTSDSSVKRIRGVLRYAYAEPYRLSWVQVRGDVKAVAGSWTLAAESPGTTRATYDLTVDPGWVFAPLLHTPLVRIVRRILAEGRPEELAAYVMQRQVQRKEEN